MPGNRAKRTGPAMDRGLLGWSLAVFFWSHRGGSHVIKPDFC